VVMKISTEPGSGFCEPCEPSVSDDDVCVLPSAPPPPSNGGSMGYSTRGAAEEDVEELPVSSRTPVPLAVASVIPVAVSEQPQRAWAQLQQPQREAWSGTPERPPVACALEGHAGQWRRLMGVCKCCFVNQLFVCRLPDPLTRVPDNPLRTPTRPSSRCVGR